MRKLGLAWPPETTDCCGRCCITSGIAVLVISMRFGFFQLLMVLEVLVMLVVMVILMDFFLSFLLGDEVLAELGSSFIDAHGMPNYFC